MHERTVTAFGAVVFPPLFADALDISITTLSAGLKKVTIRFFGEQGGTCDHQCEIPSGDEFDSLQMHVIAVMQRSWVAK